MTTLKYAKTKYLQIRVSLDLHNAALRLSLDKGVTVSEIVRQALTKLIPKRDREPAPDTFVPIAKLKAIAKAKASLPKKPQAPAKRKTVTHHLLG